MNISHSYKAQTDFIQHVENVQEQLIQSSAQDIKMCVIRLHEVCFEQAFTHLKCGSYFQVLRIYILWYVNILFLKKVASLVGLDIDAPHAHSMILLKTMSRHPKDLRALP